MTYRLGVVPKKMRRRTNRARSADGKSLIVRRAEPDEVVGLPAATARSGVPGAELLPTEVACSCVMPAHRKSTHWTWNFHNHLRNPHAAE
jgi:hypothetical protein